MEEFKASLEGKSRDELQEMLNNLDNDQDPEKYKIVLDKMTMLDEKTETPAIIEPMPEVVAESTTQEGVIHTREFANVFTRFGAIIIDGLILIPFYIPIYIITFDIESGIEPSDSFMWILFLCVIGMLAFGFWNTIIRMGQTGQSLGRKFLNIAVLNAHGKPIGIGKAALREIIGRWVSGLVCYIGYLNAFWDKHNQMWHDKIADCYVYYVEGDFS